MDVTVGATPMAAEAVLVNSRLPMPRIKTPLVFVDITHVVVPTVTRFIRGARSSMSAVSPDYIIEGGIAVA